MSRYGQAGGIADYRGDLVADRERLADEAGSGGARRAEDGEFHRVRLSGVVVQAARGRGAEILRLYLIDSGMNTALDQICAEYDDKDLQLLAGFLHRTADAARTGAERLAAS